MKIKRTFANPTYDVGFTIAFGNKIGKDITISLLNSLLNLQGEDQIKEIKLRTYLRMYCITNKGEDIIVCLLRERKNFSLPWTQIKMSRNFSAESNYVPVYILGISKEDIFFGSNDNDTLYEKTVVPMIKELNVEVPNNEMHWKFYEIDKFAKMYKNGEIKLNDGKLALKEQ